MTVPPMICLPRIIAACAVAAFFSVTATAQTPGANLRDNWTCPIGTAGTKIFFNITAVSPAVTGTVGGENSDPRYVRTWGPVNIGTGPGTVQAVPAGDEITFTLPSGTMYSNFRLSGNGAEVDFKSVIDGNQKQLTCTRD